MKRSILIFILAVMASAPAWAAGDSREKQMLRRMQQQVQQIQQAQALAEQEKAAALADRERIERERDQLAGDMRKQASARARAETELKALRTEVDELKRRLGDTEKQLADSLALQRATADRLAQAETGQRQTASQLAARQQELAQCRKHNGRLAGLGREMMEKYRDKSCSDALAQAEPFTGLKQVEIENLLEAWRDRIERDKLAQDK